jgi:hypothetical protein
VFDEKIFSKSVVRMAAKIVKKLKEPLSLRRDQPP